MLSFFQKKLVDMGSSKLNNDAFGKEQIAAKAPLKKKESFSSSDSEKKRKKKNLLTQEPVQEMKAPVVSQKSVKDVGKSKVQIEEPNPVSVSNPYNFKTKEDDKLSSKMTLPEKPIKSEKSE